jgi:hypothetical protein
MCFVLYEELNTLRYARGIAPLLAVSLLNMARPLLSALIKFL